MSTHKHGRDKFQTRAIPCIFLGYPYGKKAYKIMDITSKKVYTSRDVVFHEHVFPFSPSCQQHMPAPTDSVNSIEQPLNFPTPSFTNLPSQAKVLHPADVGPISEGITPIRRSSRTHRPPSYLDDYVHSAYKEPFCFFTLTNLSFQPLTLSSLCLSSSSQQLLNRLNYIEPQFYAEAVLDPSWEAAMGQEL